MTSVRERDGYSCESKRKTGKDEGKKAGKLKQEENYSIAL